jgi:hypothetical protein
MKKGGYRKRIAFRVQSPLLARVDAEARSTGTSRQQFLEAALAERFSEESQEERDALIARRLNRIDSRLSVIEREIEILAEWHGLYLRMWFATHPEIPEDQREAALRQAQQRYDRFLASLGKRVGSGQSLMQELPKEVALKAQDFAKP